MLPASNRGVGMNMGFPDVCLTPAVPSPVPIPYPNMAMNAMAVPFVPNIMLSMMPALNMASVIPMTMGAEPGLANPLFKQMGMYTMGNPKSLLQCLPAINLTCPTSGNNMNNPVGAVLVPSVTNVFFTHQTAPIRKAVTTGLELVEAKRLGDGLGYVAIRAFARDVAGRVFHALTQLAPIESLIIDLRDNPGGEMEAWIELASDFLQPGTTIVRAVDREGDETEYRAHGQTMRHAMPLVVFVNGHTASSAELFAGVLQAHGRAVIAGSRTFGEGIVWRNEFHAGYGAVSPICARCLLPDGSEVHGVGVRPDVELTDEEMTAIAEIALEETSCYRNLIAEERHDPGQH